MTDIRELLQTLPYRSGAPDYKTRIVVIGASLTGPTAALHLYQRGYRNIVVLDATSPNASRAGGNIGIDEAQVKQMSTVGLSRAEVVPIEAGTEYLRHVDASGNLLSREDMPQTWLYTHWNPLNAALMRQLRSRAISVQLHRRCTGVVVNADDGSATVLATLADPKAEPQEYKYDADFVVAAGGKSFTVPDSPIAQKSFSYDGVVAWRGQVVLRGAHSDDALYRLSGRWSSEVGLQFLVAPTRFDEHAVLDWTMYTPLTHQDAARRLNAPPESPFVPSIPPGTKQWLCGIARRQLPDAAEFVETCRPFAVPMITAPWPKQMSWKIGSAHVVVIGDAVGPVHPLSGEGLKAGLTQASELPGVFESGAYESFEKHWLGLVAAANEKGRQKAIERGVGPSPLTTDVRDSHHLLRSAVP